MTLFRTLALGGIVVAGLGAAVAATGMIDFSSDPPSQARPSADPNPATTTAGAETAAGVPQIVEVIAGNTADGWQNYSPAVFTAAQQAGKTILVDVTASWCPTCRAQKPTLNELAAEDRLSDIVFVRVDFDAHKDFLRAHHIPSQSTVVVFDGTAEVARSVAETDRDRLRGFVFDAVGL